MKLTDHKLEIDYGKKGLMVKGSGDIFLQNHKDQFDYLLNNKDGIYDFRTSIEIKKNPLLINFLNYEKKEENNFILKLQGKKNLDNEIKFDIVLIEEKDNKIKLEKLILDKDFKIVDLNKAEINFLDKEGKKNKFNIIKKNNTYFLKGSTFNANSLIQILIDDENKSDFINKKFDLNIMLKKLLVDNNHILNNFKGKLSFDNHKIIKGNLIGNFSSNEKLKFTLQSNGDEKITTFFLGRAEAIISRYKFIKGFEEGMLDFYSSKKGDQSSSILKIYDFKLKELPALTKLLTLASLQGIADVLSGEGIRFNEFEMNFNNKKNLMTINEIYAIGPAISILMNGYVEKNKLVSLRGTLVPATTINSVIGSIPILGKILVGSKTGEGVFGVSFKVKGPPKNLETTVNPIKTLTPRFITRTLEKIKKN